MGDPGDESIVAQFSADGQKERAKWYLNALEEITDRKKEPAHGGSETFFLAHEVGSAYVNGLYIATILLSAAIVEHEIFGELVYRGVCDSNEKIHLPTIVDKAEAEGLVDSEEADLVMELNSDRISFFHYRDFEHEDSPLQYVFENQNEPYYPYGEYEKRARHAIETWLKIGIKPWTEWSELYNE